jgi:hypothetical protein
MDPKTLHLECLSGSRFKDKVEMVGALANLTADIGNAIVLPNF